MWVEDRKRQEPGAADRLAFNLTPDAEAAINLERQPQQVELPELQRLSQLFDSTRRSAPIGLRHQRLVAGFESSIDATDVIGRELSHKPARRIKKRASGIAVSRTIIGTSNRQYSAN